MTGASAALGRVLSQVERVAPTDTPVLLLGETDTRKDLVARALQRTIGRFEVAHGGSIFLDEIGELPLEVQAKLVRVLESVELERLVSPRTIKVDVRLISASRDLERAVREGRFRADPFYRSSVFPIMLPPPRERPEDIPVLVATDPLFLHAAPASPASSGTTLADMEHAHILAILEEWVQSAIRCWWPGDNPSAC